MRNIRWQVLGNTFPPDKRFIGQKSINLPQMRTRKRQEKRDIHVRFNQGNSEWC
jgi:hypothetical protein